MKLNLRCESCGEEIAEVVTDSKDDAAWKAESLLLLSHATKHTALCELAVHGREKGPSLTIDCLLCSVRQVFESVPKYLVGACVIAFHASHEGHRLAFEYMGQKFVGPEKSEKSETKKPAQ